MSGPTAPANATRAPMRAADTAALAFMPPSIDSIVVACTLSPRVGTCGT